MTGTAFVVLGLQSSVFSLQPSINFLFFIILHTSYFVLLSAMIVIFLADLKYEIIPMEMIVVGFISAFLIHFMNFITFTNFLNFLLSGLGAGLFFFLLWFFSKGKAMGDGDMYLAGLIGFLLGFPKIIISLYGAFLTGAIIGIILVLRRKKSLKAHIPFGPFLILGCGIALVWGDKILQIWRMVW